MLPAVELLLQVANNTEECHRKTFVRGLSLLSKAPLRRQLGARLACDLFRQGLSLNLDDFFGSSKSSVASRICYSLESSLEDTTMR
jgi:hypothetical protein